MQNLRILALLLLVVAVAGNPPSLDLERSHFAIRGGSFLTNKFSVLIYQLYFDQDLFLLDSSRCPTVSKSSCASPVPCVCDYESLDKCGQNCPSCSLTPCNRTWESIQPEEPKEMVIPAGGTREYRMYWSSRCSNILRVRLEAEYGEPFLQITDGLMANTYFQPIQTPAGEEAFLCPFYNLNPTTIRIFVSSPFVSRVRLTVTRLGSPRQNDTVRIVPPNQSCNPASPLSPTVPFNHLGIQDIRCLSDGLARKSDHLNSIYGDYAYYYFEIVGPCPHLFSLSLLTPTVGDVKNSFAYFVGVNLPTLPGRDNFTTMLSLDSHLSFTGSTCPQGNKSEIWVKVLPYFSADLPLPTIFGISSPDLFFTRSFSDLFPVEAADVLSVTSKLRCPGIVWQKPRNPDQFASLDFLSCTQRFSGYGCETLDTHFQMILPEKNITPFWPPFPSQIQLDSAFYLSQTPPVSPTPVEPKKLSAMLIIEKQGTNADTEQTNYATLLPVDKISNCYLEFTGSLVNSEYEALVTNPKEFLLSESHSPCVYEDLLPLVNKMSELILNVSLQNVREQQYQIDYFTFGELWTSCQDYMNSMIDENDGSSVEQSTACTALPDSPEFWYDPCCFWQQSWKSCCLPRDEQIPFTERALDQISQQKFCPVASSRDEACVSSLLTDYISQIGDVNECFQIADQGAVFASKKDWEFWFECEEFVWGPHLRGGPNCVFDLDCPNHDYCSLRTGQCSFFEPDQKFLECFESKADPFVLFSLSTTGTDMFAPFWIDGCQNRDKTYFRSDQSTNPPRSVWGWEEPSEICEISDFCYENFEALFPKGDLPFLCSAPHVCNKFWSEKSTMALQLCESQTSCNQVNSSLGCPATFCGVCQQDGFCLELPGSDPSCNGISGACFLPSGVVNATKEECNSLWECDNAGCSECGREQCENQGQCSDQQLINSRFPQIADASGYCRLDTSNYWRGDIYINNTDRNPYNRPYGDDCGNQLGDDVGHVSGCLRLTFKSELMDEATCESWPNSTWFSWAKTEEECHSRTGCNQYLPTLYYNAVNVTTRRSPEECSACGDIPTPFFEWKAGHYRQGQFHEVSTFSGSMISVSQRRSVLDYNALGTAVQNALDQKYGLAYRSSFECKLNQFLQTVNVTACLCLSDLSPDDCISGLPSQSGIATACSGSSGTFLLNPAIITLGSMSFNRTTCVTMISFKISVEEFRGGSPKVSYSGTLWSEDQQQLDYGFQNRHKKLVGKVLGDGVTLQRSDSSFVQFELCLKVNKQIPEEYDDFDFGRRTKPGERVKPLEIPAEYRGGMVCGNVTFENLFGNSAYPSLETAPSSGDVIVPIIRSRTWDSDTIKLQEPDRIAFIIGSICYCIIFVQAALLMLQIRSLKLTLANSNFWIALLFLIFSALRVCWMVSLAVNSLQNAPSVWDYILVELPSAVFLTAFMFIITFWVFLVQTMKSTSGQDLLLDFKRATVFINLLLYVIWIITAVLFQVFNDGYSEEVYCGGRIVESTDGGSKSRKVTLAYRCILVIISVGLSLAFLFYGPKIYKMKTAVSKQRSLEEQRIFGLSVICFISFIIHAVYLMIVSITEYSNTVVGVSILLIVEFPPSFLMLILIQPQKSADKRRRATTGSSHSASKYNNNVSAPSSGDSSLY